jgi:hypothetical protein
VIGFVDSGPVKGQNTMALGVMWQKPLMWTGSKERGADCGEGVTFKTMPLPPVTYILQLGLTFEISLHLPK